MSSETQNQRINFASIKNPMQYPDFLEVQLKSFQDFLQLDTPPEKRKNDGLYKVFAENFPIADTRNNFVLEFLDYYIDPPHYTIDDCLERGLTYSVPLKAKLKLYCTDPDHEDFDTVIQDVYLGPIPYMTPKGTFVINGAERVVVSQLHRSPGVFFGQSIHANGTKLYSARIIPFKGSWIEFDTGVAIYTGSTLHEVAHVAGAGNAMDPTDSLGIAGTATITKMIRVMMLAPVLVIMSFALAGRKKANPEGKAEKSKITIPWFAFGFIGIICLNSLLQYLTGAETVKDIPLNGAIEYIDTFMLTMAMTALGTDTSLEKFKQAGAKPFLLAGLLYIWLVGGGYLLTQYITPMFE